MITAPEFLPSEEGGPLSTRPDHLLVLEMVEAFEAASGRPVALRM